MELANKRCTCFTFNPPLRTALAAGFAGANALVSLAAGLVAVWLGVVVGRLI